MKIFTVLNLKTDSRKLIISTSYVSPLSKLRDMESDLKAINYNGEVLFDLLLSNGFAKNRFLKGYFDGERINLNEIKIISSMDGNILDEIYLFLAENPNYVDASSLSDSHKQIIYSKALVGEVSSKV